MHLARALRLAVGSLVLVVTVLVATGAGAHALLTTSDPPAGATLARSPTEIVITFGEQPDPRLSSIKVLDTSGQTKAGGRPLTVAGKPDTLRVTVPSLPNGVYTVAWQTVSKVDGHLAGGAYSFGIGVSPAGATAPKAATIKTPRPSGLALASRWVFFAGLIGLLGLAFTELVVMPNADERVAARASPALALAWVLAVAGTVGLTQAQAGPAHVGLSHVLSSSLGHGLKVRGSAVLVAGVALLVALLGSRRLRRPALWLLGAAALAAMLADVTTSHAAAAPGWEWFRVGTQWVHFAAVGIWIGGLAGVLLCLGALATEVRGPVLRRYSFVAGLCLIVVLLSGSLRAVDEIGTWHELVTTGFGQLVLIKLGLLSSLAGLGALNRYRNLPRAGRTARGLRITGTTELAVVALVLFATAALQNLAPARSAASTRPVTVGPLVVDAHDFATTVRLHLVVTPGMAGFNQFRLLVLGYDTGQTVQADKVSMQFHVPDRTDVGDSTMVLARNADGSYSGHGPNLSIEGRWNLTVLVQRGLQSTDVTMDLVTQTSFQPTDAQRTAGLPTFYNIHLAGGRQIQVYLDPNHPGFNQFHSTFLDASGNELNIATFSVTDALEPGGSATILTTRKLDNQGHYVADAPVQRGIYRFSMAATTTAGDAVSGEIDIPVK